tara:strand:+ start:8314 stop:8730 length:417 start_codon:yes stop_codon:yes gene_type:complete
MDFKKAKDKLKDYLIFTGILWILLPVTTYIIINVFGVSGGALESLLQGIFGVLGLYWIYDTFMSIKPIYIVLKSGTAFKDIFTKKTDENNNSNDNQSHKLKEVIIESNEKDGEQVVRNFTTLILIILALMLFVSILSL